MSTPRAPAASPFAARARGLALAWVALLILMLLSLGSAYLKLGAGNAVTGLVIAAIKATIVAWWFMQLRLASATVRAAALVGLFVLALLATLSGVDYATRLPEPAPVQAPRQLELLLDLSSQPPMTEEGLLKSSR
jgi:cytochrome c oxidase subunit IV